MPSALDIPKMTLKSPTAAIVTTARYCAKQPGHSIPSARVSKTSPAGAESQALGVVPWPPQASAPRCSRGALSPAIPHRTAGCSPAAFWLVAGQEHLAHRNPVCKTHASLLVFRLQPLEGNPALRARSAPRFDAAGGR